MCIKAIFYRLCRFLNQTSVCVVSQGMEELFSYQFLAQEFWMDSIITHFPIIVLLDSSFLNVVDVNEMMIVNLQVSYSCLEKVINSTHVLVTLSWVQLTLSYIRKMRWKLFDVKFVSDYHRGGDVDIRLVGKVFKAVVDFVICVFAISPKIWFSTYEVNESNCHDIDVRFGI